MPRPRVTIVTPSYNQAAFLEEAIRSVLDQGYENLEYIVVDGGSTDGSVEIIERYADRLAWWVSEPDGGQAEALNSAFARSTGELLGWLNSDDTLLPGAVSAAVEAFEHEPDLLLAYGDAIFVDEDGARVGYYSAQDADVPGMLRRCFDDIVQQGSLFSREAYDLAGPLHGWFCLDFEFFLKVAMTGPVRRLDRPLATYRLHPESKSMTATTRRAEDYVRMYDAIFGRDDLPADVRAVEREARAAALVLAGEDYYAGFDFGRARACYVQALRLHPRGLTPHTASLLARTVLPARLVRALRAARGARRAPQLKLAQGPERRQ